MSTLTLTWDLRESGQSVSTVYVVCVLWRHVLGHLRRPSSLCSRIPSHEYSWGTRTLPFNLQVWTFTQELNLDPLGWEPTLLATTLTSLKRCRKATVEAMKFLYNINTPYIKCISVHKLWVIWKWHFLSHRDIYFGCIRNHLKTKPWIKCRLEILCELSWRLEIHY